MTGTLRHLLSAAIVLMAGLWQPALCEAQSEDLSERSLEDLMNIEVTTVGKKQQRLSQIPAAVYVITQEEIRRSGATSLPDVLRLVPGVEVAQIDNSNWAISIRGFNFRSSNKLLVLIDGRAVYYPTYSNVFWDVQSTLLEDIQRIEVIRGPGASLWGANAVNGVINIVTKNARNTPGGLIAAKSGSYDLANVAVRYGLPAHNNGAYRLFGTYSLRDNLVDLPDGRSLQGRPQMVRGGFRSDWNLAGGNALTISGDLYEGAAPQAGYLSPLLRSEVKTDTHVDASGGNVLLRWTHRSASGSETTLQTYFDRNRHADIFLGQVHDVLDFDFQHHIRAQGHDLLWGAGFRSTRQASQGSWQVSLRPSARNLHLFSGFLQDDVTLVPNRLVLTAGARLEHNDFTGVEIQPSLRLLWTPSPRRTAWASVSRAVRTPSVWESAVDMNLVDTPLPDGTLLMTHIAGSSHLQSEELLAYEIGYRSQAREDLTLDVAGFYQHYSHLSSIFLGEPYFSLDPEPRVTAPMYVSNLLSANTYGLEVSNTYSPVARWKIVGSYSWLRQITHAPSGEVFAFAGGDGDIPQHQFQLRSYLSLPHQLEADTAVYYVGRLPLQPVKGYTRWDMRLGWRPDAAWEFSLNAQNLLASPHYEFNPPEESIVVGKVKRAIYGKVTWRF